MERMSDDCVEIATEAQDNVHFVRREEVGIILEGEEKPQIPSGDFSRANG